MARSGIARRYAQAVFDIARAEKSIDRWQADLEAVSRSLMDPAIHAYVESPKHDPAAKQALLAQWFSKAVEPKVLSLLYVLDNHGRLGLIDEVRQAFEELADAERGVVRAVVTTAIPLDERVASTVRRQLEEFTGKRIVLESQVDPSIIGGMVLRLGDRVLDGSTRTKLAAMRRNLRGIGR